MKKIFSFIITFFMMTTLVCAYPVIEQTEEKTLIKGVEYKNIKGLYESGWQNIHVVTADLTEKHLKLEVLKNKNGESYMEKTITSAVNNDAVVAVNGDFFAAKKGESGRGSAIGVEVRDGKLYSSASVLESMNTLYKTFNDKGFNIDAFEFDITLTAKNGLQDKIKLVNKYDDLTGIVMYTSDWNETSVGSSGGVIEVSVDKFGKVVEKVTESEPIVIPDGGYVLSAHMSYNTFLLDNVNVGDTLKIDIASTPDYKKIETAVGGGGVLVRDGVAQKEFSHNISGKNPRTAIGLDETGTKVTLVVLDGRQKEAKGMTQTELADLMVELGCFSALNFDGGGSSVMVCDDFGDKKIVNTPSDGASRYVTNSIGITTTAPESTKIKKINIEAPQNAFCGYGAYIYVTSIDEFLRPVKIKEKVIYKTDNGIIKDGILIPEKEGIANVTATVSGVSAKTSINVLDDITEINFSQNKYEIKSTEILKPVLIAKNKDGKSANISLNDVKFTASDDFAIIENGAVKGVSKGGLHITAKCGSLTANAQVLVDGAESVGTIENVKINDEKNVSKDVKDGGYRFSVFGNTKKNEILFDMFVMNRATIKMKNSSDFQFFLGGDVNSNTLSYVAESSYLAKEYNCMTKNGDTFITLPNASSKIYTSDASIWTKFQEDVKNAKGNLFVFLDRNFISENAVEVSVFKQILEEQSDNKTVYVFGGGFVNSATVENNIRYVNTAGFFNSVAIDGTSVDVVQYVLVTVNGEEVTYEYKQAVK